MTRLLFLLVLLAALPSCQRRECTNTNPVIAQDAFHTSEYKAELAKLIQQADADNLEYWLAYYYRQYGKDYATVYVQGNGICAMMLLDITNGKGWKEFKEAEGAGYNGAQLIGLKYRIEQQGLQTDFVYEEMELIID